MQAGEKMENAGSNPVMSSIFGTTINGFYNQNAIDDTKLNSWITNANGARTEATETVYDIADWNSSQANL